MGNVEECKQVEIPKPSVVLGKVYKLHRKTFASAQHFPLIRYRALLHTHTPTHGHKYTDRAA